MKECPVFVLSELFGRLGSPLLTPWSLNVLSLLVVFSIAFAITAHQQQPSFLPNVLTVHDQTTYRVHDVALDFSGNIFLTNSYHSVDCLTSAPATATGVGSSAALQLVAGSGVANGGGTGSTDGPALAARFYNPIGITFDTNNIAYISDCGNNRIRMLHLSTTNSYAVTTLAGTTSGYNDAVGTAARFSCPRGIVYHKSCGSSGGVLYVLDSTNFCVRKILVATANVTTVAALPAGTYGWYLCITNNGTYLYITIDNIVVRVNAADGAVLPLAGNTSASGRGFADGVGSSARFYGAFGIALNTDESALVIVDNWRIRKLLLANNNVTTVAGSGAGYGIVDGPALTATFSSLHGAKWHCNATAGTCGVLVADNGAVRIVALELGTTPTAAATGATETASNSLSVPQSDSILSLAASISRSPSLKSSRSLRYSSATFSDSGAHASKSTTPTPRVTASLGTPSDAQSVSRATATHSLSLFLAAATHTSTPQITSSASPSLHTASHSPPSATPSPTSSAPTVAQSRTAATPTGPTHSTALSNSCAATPSHALFSRSNTRDTSAITPSVYCAVALTPNGGSIHPLTRDALPASVTVVALDDAAAPALPLVATAAGIARVLLFLPHRVLAVNLSLALGGFVRSGRPLDNAWALTQATLDVFLDPSGAAMPLLSAAVPFTVAHTVVAGSQQFTTVHLSAPLADSGGGTTRRWLPASLSAFRAAVLAVTLVWRCPEDPSVTASVVLRVPCPGEAQPLAAEVKAASTAAQYSAALAGPASGGAVGRVAAVRSLVLCSADTVAEGLLPLTVRACDDVLTSALARGAVIGNLTLFAAACLLMAAVATAYAQVACVQACSAVVALGIPSPLLPLVTATVPSTAAATFYLLQRRACAVDGAIAAVGVAMCFFPIAALVLLAYVVPRELRLVRLEVPPSAVASSCVPVPLLSRLFYRRSRWIDAESDGPGGGAAELSGLRRCATVVLLDYAAVWYAAVDIAVLAAACLLGAVSALGSAGACRGSAVAVLLLYGGLLALCAVAQPFTTLFSHVYALTSLALSTVAVACQVWYLFGVTDDDADLEALRKLLTVAAVCDLLVAGISVAKASVDGIDMLRACRRHAAVMYAVLRGKAAETLHPTPNDTTDANAEDGCQQGVVASLLTDEELAPPMYDDDAFLFLTLDEGGHLRDADVVGIATAREATVRDGNDLMRLYGLSR
jgi:hypothetical protein